MTDVRFINVDNDPGVSVTYAVTTEAGDGAPVLGHVFREVDSKVWLSRPKGRKNPLKTDSKTRKEAAALVIAVVEQKAAAAAARKAEKEAAAAAQAEVDAAAEVILDAKDAAEANMEAVLTPIHATTGTSSVGTITSVKVTGVAAKPTLRVKLRKFFKGY